MAHKTKAQRAAYMRKWRERQKADAAGRGESHGVLGTTPESPLPPAPAGSPLQSTSVQITHTAPGFLAAPVDTCPVCGHDRQEADHLGGRPCKFRLSPRRPCGCMFEGF